ncbi:hypothetical protein [Tsukamurella pseudospumae]|uniref:Uncharacterized protein n=1 Tax=Tsukamurella pseudospumae TaxID=239498 RepID=A0A138AW52_9ACTN|nr:hypothetical protein [Tsukamurella pseudospumae]KXP14697.1 hypothetical protein AXK60_02065 [Tsukamurella pseudospumae]
MSNPTITTATDLARLRALLAECDDAANDASEECQAYDRQGVPTPPFVRDRAHLLHRVVGQVAVGAMTARSAPREETLALIARLHNCLVFGVDSPQCAPEPLRAAPADARPVIGSGAAR